MSDLVDSSSIEAIVGTSRHATAHYGRAISAEQVVFILHSQACLDARADLRTCAFSRALDRGIDPARFPEDTPVRLALQAGLLVAVTS